MGSGRGTARGRRRGDAFPVTHSIPRRSAAAAGHPDSSRRPGLCLNSAGKASFPPCQRPGFLPLRGQGDTAGSTRVAPKRMGTGDRAQGSLCTDKLTSLWPGLFLLCQFCRTAKRNGLPTSSPGAAPTPSTAQLCDSVSLCWGEEKRC